MTSRTFCNGLILEVQAELQKDQARAVLLVYLDYSATK